MFIIISSQKLNININSRSTCYQNFGQVCFTNKNVVSQHKFLYGKAQKKFFMSNTTH